MPRPPIIRHGEPPVLADEILVRVDVDVPNGYTRVKADRRATTYYVCRKATEKVGWSSLINEGHGRNRRLAVNGEEVVRLEVEADRSGSAWTESGYVNWGLDGLVEVEVVEE